MFFTTSDGKELFYEVSGNLNSADTLVFLNGLSQSTQAWALITPHFKDQYKMVYLDFIFQGQSEKSGEVRSFDKHANDVIELMRLLGISSFIPVGISYGSLVAQHLAYQYSDYLPKLILLSTFAHKTPYYEAVELSWHRALDMGGYGLMLDVMLPLVLSENYFNHPLIPIEMMKEARKGLNDNPEALKKLMIATRDREDYREKLKTIKTPTLVVHGEYDLLFPVHMGQTVAECLPNSRFELIANAGHTLNIEAAPQLAKSILSFL